MSIQSTVQNFHPSGKFLMFIGMFLLGLALASIAQVIIILPFSDMKSINDLAKLEDFSNPNIIKAMKIAQAVSAILMFIIPSLVFAFLSSEKKISALKMNKGFHPMIGLAAIALVFVAMPVINWTGELNSHLALPDFMSGVEKWMKNSEDSLKKLTDAFLQMNGIGDLIVNVIVIALLAAVGEELLFRGTIQTIFIEWMKNKHVAIIVTSILFSALHAQFYGFLPRMLLGVVLGYLYLWSGSLWLSMLFHFLNNGIAVLFSYLIGKGKIDESAETIGAGSSPIYLVIASMLIGAGIMFYIYKNRKAAED